MDKSVILNKIVHLRNLKRELEELSKELNISDIESDKIYLAITIYHTVLSNLIKEEHGKQN